MVAGSGGGEEERPRQWQACCGIGRAAAAQCLHSGVVGARGGWHACCGVGKALVAVSDEGCGGCDDVALLGRWRRYRGMRAVAGMGQWARRCRGRRAAVSGIKREVAINMLLGGVCGKELAEEGAVQG